ncbi:MAG: pyruvate carboxylase, partial [Flavobacteriales bacterium]|nr:pyruvate carboxylase [Flavobacteriales bacterium]
MENKPEHFEIKKLLVANRGEIAIRVLRAAAELGVRTVAVFTNEDRYSLHKFKADESYQICKDDEALKPYLDIDAIVSLAKLKGVDAIHPGYGFLSENVEFATKCREAGIKFVGPTPEAMAMLGDKVAAKKIAITCNVPIIEGNKQEVTTVAIAEEEATRIGFPVMLKAASGGGGRGMRVVRKVEDISKAFTEGGNEALRAFGDGTMFIEKFVDNPKHIEVQIMADEHGNMVHLYERDCSVQRRFQKVVEVAPCSSIKQETKDALYKYAIAICKHVDYSNVGTVEFLVDKEENIYFIEVNPRIQVEHTITEEITSIDIVRSQIVIATGRKLSHPQIFIKSQEDIKCEGFAIQCRITTEDPLNDFTPDYGTIIAYRNAAGFGIRLDEGSSSPGTKISPFFDSMLCKVSASGRTLKGASQRLNRALSEFRIRGVKTNIKFVQNVITHDVFKEGNCTVQFIENYPELFDFKRSRDRGTKLLNYLGETIVNGNPDVKFVDKTKIFIEPVLPDFDRFAPFPDGTKQLLDKHGPEAFAQLIRADKQIHYTDTTFRDAHQSLLATRMRTLDMLNVADRFVKNNPQMFSMEVWGGATFDVAYRFLKESPWKRLQLFREHMPNTLLQMLIRGSNAVGYTAYPDNLIERFIEKSAENGVDVFRIFDSLNWLDGMKTSIKAVKERTNAIAEGCICYTGDILDPNQTKYTLDYYVDLAKRLRDEGIHILAIKDMAGLLKPYSAEVLISKLKEELDIPIHLHTQDTSGLQVATYMKAVEAGVDIVDVSLASMSGLTSQPNFNSIVKMLEGTERERPMNVKSLNEFSNYWEAVREVYYPFESGLKAGTAQIFDHEIPGGQYSNLRPQARGLGLEHKFETIKKNYQEVNKLFGDLVKVTPSSKVVGDMAMFLTSNDLTCDDVREKGNELSFPDSVKALFRGDLGQAYGGFPEDISKMILKDEKPYTNKPNEHLEPIDIEKDIAAFQQEFSKHCDELDFLSYKLYPKVFKDYYTDYQKYGDLFPLPSKAFFFGLSNNEEINIKLGNGQSILVKLLYVTDPNEDGIRSVFFKFNGTTRVIEIKDKNVKSDKVAHVKAAADNEIGAPLQGSLSSVVVKAGDTVKKNDPLFIIEAMKMETTITAIEDTTIKQLVLKSGVMVNSEDLI